MRVRQKIAHQPLHARRAASQKAEHLERLVVEIRAVVPDKKFAVNHHAAQRLLEIVAGGISELFQVDIGSRQFLIGLRESRFAFFALIYIGRGPEPFHNLAIRASHGNGTHQKPAQGLAGKVRETGIRN